MKKQNFYHPKFIPTWILIGLMKLGTKLPFKVQVAIGNTMGIAFYPILRRFRKIAFVNISACFPNKTHVEVEALVRQNFKALGISIFETANTYFATDKKIKSMLSINNEHYLTDAINKDQSVILLAAHFMPLMLGVRMLLSRRNIASIYRPQNNALFDKMMRKSSTSRGALIIKTKDTRAILKALKNKIPIWYAPDQDLGKKNCVFAPFFNIQTATVAATAKLANKDNTVVIPYFFIRTKSGYSMNFEAPIANYPDNDAVISASMTNKILEAQILKNPEQYLWVHRRFKTRPDGEPGFY
ncbi:lipid A biosynthesis acyltransferase [Candidatus Thioglobus sp.]|uniref:LpxL/LpxP family acyltransferase n=1 Tax=Candidatus Thioglobus sp. TaxID=2026721 RepID=UPI003D0AEC14